MNIRIFVRNDMSFVATRAGAVLITGGYFDKKFKSLFKP